MISATDNLLRLDLLVQFDKAPADFFASSLPSVDLPAPRRPIRAMPANDVRLRRRA